MSATSLKDVIGARTPITGLLRLTIPEYADNGKMVSFTIEGPAAEDKTGQVKTLHLFAPGNTHPLVARFDVTPASGRAAVSGRLRLAKAQEVVALAECADGRLLIDTRTVAVAVGGCG